jgi:hypothetical protein
MNVGVIASFVILGIVVIIGLGLVLRRTMLLARIFRRIAPALVEWDDFNKLLVFHTDQSHFMERHGPMTFEEEQLQRALTGMLDAAGLTGRPVDAARWLRHRDLHHALEHVQARWIRGERPQRGVFRMRFSAPIGKGFTADSQSLIFTSYAMAIVRNGRFVTAFPVIAPDLAVAWEAVQDTAPTEAP